MPYIIRPPKLLHLPDFLGCALAAVAAMLLFGAASAHAEKPSTEASSCIEPELSQPFLSANDSSYYMLAPGQSNGSFQGNGWLLSGGAKIVQDTLPSGQTGSVLELPSGSQAVSPTICVTTAYPKARMNLRDVLGGGGVSFSVSYAGSHSWEHPHKTGEVHGSKSEWALGDPVQMQPEHVEGWQLVQVTLTASGKKSEFQVDNFYIDPYRR